MTPLTLPFATGGNGTITYTLTPALPAGLTHNAAARTITGNPTATLPATMFTYTATDGDDNTAGSDTDTLTFSITVEADIAPAFATDASIPNQTFAVGETVALTLPAVETPGNGATRYFLSTPYSLPSGGSIFGLTYDEATLTLTGTATAGTRSLLWVASDSDNNFAADDQDRLAFIITVGEDTAPAFAVGATIDDQTYTQGVPITNLTLPVATGGNGTITYALTPPAGLTFNAATRVLSGRPQALTSSETVAYTASDADPNTAADDTATLTFSITVEVDIAPAFAAGETILDQTFAVGEVVALTLPAVETPGNGATTYTLYMYPGNAQVMDGESVLGLTYNADARTLTGMGTAGFRFFDWFAEDSDFNNEFSDRVSLDFDITVGEGIVPDFGDGVTIDNQTLAVGETVALTLPAATGGTGAINYTLYTSRGQVMDGESILGLTYNAATRTLTGMVTAGTFSFDWSARDSAVPFAHYSDTLEFIITVGEDTAPAFSDGASIADRFFTPGRSVYLNLPVATGGNGALRYTLTPALPAGLTFRRSSGFLTGTPPTAAPTTMYTYTVTDSDPNNMADDTATLTFSITVEEDIAPDFGTATIADQAFDIDETVALTLPVVETPGNGATRYFLYNRTGQAYVEDGASVIGLTYNAAARTFTGTVTAGLRFFVWVAEDSDASFRGDFDTLDFSITVETDAPDFGAVTIADQIFAPDRSVTLTLPAVEIPGNGGTSYTLSNLSTLPAGLTFNAATRVLSGTPTAVTTATMYTYTARDSDDDTDTLTFSITVEANIVPDFGMATLGNQTYIVGETVALTLPAVETPGNGATRYLLYNSTDGAYAADGASVLGLTFDRTARTLIGTATAGTTTLFWDAFDSDANTALSDAATLFFTITVGEDTAPDFANASIADQIFVSDQSVALTLPIATGGNGTITYTLTPALPDGLTFNSTTRGLTGTPTTAATATMYTYMAHDSDDNIATDDTATLTFSIAVEADIAPDFGDGVTIADQTYTRANSRRLSH